MKHNWIADMRPGYLHPMFHQEVTPGDQWYGNIKALLRMAPLDLPAFVQFNVDVNIFFVPHRLTFPEFEDVMTGVDQVTTWPTISQTYLGTLISPLPVTTSMGLGYKTSGTLNVNAQPVAAYNECFNQFYRNQNHADERALTANSLAPVYHPASDYYASVSSEIQQTSEVTVDVSGGTLSLNTLRDAKNEQRWRERRSRYGERYTDLLHAMGVRPPESRLDRPEHVARARTVMNVSEIVAMASSTGEETGEYRGHGIGALRLKMRPRVFTEHGILIGLCTVRQRNQLKTPLQRAWRNWAQTNHFAREELYSPEYANDQMEAFYAAECNIQATNPETIIGYTPRYEWLRKTPDIIAGAMKLSAQDNWLADKDPGATPSLLSLQQCHEPTQIFQDSTLTTPRIFYYGENNLKKRSIIKPARR